MKDAAVYAVGNGSVIAYGREMDWIQVFGSPYTIPTVFSLTPAVPVTAATERVPEANVWRHTMPRGRAHRRRTAGSRLPAADLGRCGNRCCLHWISTVFARTT